MPNDRQLRRNTVVFLQIAAIELRTLARRAPEIAEELRHMAWELDAEAQDLAGADDHDWRPA